MPKRKDNSKLADAAIEAWEETRAAKPAAHPNLDTPWRQRARKDKIIADAAPVWLDPRAQTGRFGKSWMTLNRWMNDPRFNYPRPEKWFGKTPMTRLSTIEAWEASLPSEPPEHPNLNTRSRQRPAPRSMQPAE
jgi:hypothetical protein